MPLRAQLRARLRRRLLGEPPAPSSPLAPASRLAQAPAPPRLPLSDYRPRLGPLSPDWLHPILRDALSSDDPSAACETPAPGLFTLPVLTPEACGALLEELRRFEAWAAEHSHPPSRPNSMNEYGAMLDEMGLTAISTALTEQVMRPLTARLFPEVGGHALTDPHGFFVEYSPGGDRSLGFHVDDSEVTLNLCLGEDFSGGELYFEGRRCALHRQSPTTPGERVEVEHRPGVALLHTGKHRHGALRLMGGRRVNLIVWARSPSYRAGLVDGEEAECPVWCPAG